MNGSISAATMTYAIAEVVPGHLDDVKSQRLEQINKVERGGDPLTNARRLVSGRDRHGVYGYSHRRPLPVVLALMVDWLIVASAA